MVSEALQITRRRMLQIGTLGLAGITLPKLLWADAERNVHSVPAPADHCILIFLNGGPSHLDMFDMKPDAPAEMRSPFAPIATSLPGFLTRSSSMTRPIDRMFSYRGRNR